MHGVGRRVIAPTSCRRAPAPSLSSLQTGCSGSLLLNIVLTILVRAGPRGLVGCGWWRAQTRVCSRDAAPSAHTYTHSHAAPHLQGWVPGVIHALFVIFSMPGKAVVVRAPHLSGTTAATY